MKIFKFVSVNKNSRIYSEEHNERIDLLKRAGWNIINTPYFVWYNNGKIDRSNIDSIEEMERIEKIIVDTIHLREI